MKYEEAFRKIKESLKNADISGLSGDFAIQIDLINKDCCGAFYISYIGGVFAVEPYDYVDNNARLSIMFGDFNKLVCGKLNVQKAMDSRKIRIDGDSAVVEALSTLVKAPKKSAAAKPPVKKKEAAAKKKGKASK